MYSVTPGGWTEQGSRRGNVRRPCFHAEPLPKTFVELPDYFDIDTRTTCWGSLRRCLYGTRQAARSWQREIEKGIKAAGMVVGKMSKGSFKSPREKLVGVVHGDDILLAGPRSLVGAARKSLRKRHETREQMMGAGPTDASEIVILNIRVQWTEEGTRISPDPRLVKKTLRNSVWKVCLKSDWPDVQTFYSTAKWHRRSSDSSQWRR